MADQKHVRTYLDPDAAGPLPRASFADDSDALAAARTLERPALTTTVEIAPSDVIEIFDPARPARRPPSLAPVGYDTDPFVLPRRRYGAFVAGVLALAVVILAVAALRSLSSDEAPPGAAAAPAAPLAPPRADPGLPRPSSTVGTLRFDPVLGRRITVDGVALTAEAALVRCGPHEVLIASAGPARLVEVPCGGEVTITR
jgi:hypothetical protein